MAELSSPLQVTHLIDTNCASDTGIYSIYRFIGDDYGKEYIGFAVFYSADNDMDREWFKDVKLLWEKGTRTAHGTQFLEEKWKIDQKGKVYRNNKNQTIKFGSGPFGKDGEKIEILALKQIPKNSKQAAQLIREIDPISKDETDLDKLSELFGFINNRSNSQEILFELAMDEHVHMYAKELTFTSLHLTDENLFAISTNTKIPAKIRGESVITRFNKVEMLKKILKMADKELKPYIKKRIKLLR